MITPEPKDLAVAAAVGGALSLDATAMVQSMLSQPIAAGAAVGIALGDPATGLAVGALVQLLFGTELPLGTSVPPDTGTAAASLAAAAVIAHRSVPALASLPGGALWCVAAATLLAWPAALAAGRADVAIRFWNARWAKRSDLGLEAGHPRAVDRAILSGAISFGVKGIVTTAVLVLAGTPWVAWIASAASSPAVLGKAPGALVALLPAAALGALARSLADRPSREVPATLLSAVGAGVFAFFAPVGATLPVLAGAAAGLAALVASRNR